MALAEARAAWQRTANRCLVQEDAKRAPRLACCSSLPPSAKQDESGPTSPSSTEDTPSSNALPANLNPSNPNLSPNSRWWLQTQPNYLHQKGLMDDHITQSEDDSVLVDQVSDVEFPFDNQYRSFLDKKEFEDEKLQSLYNQNSLDAMKHELEEDVKEVKDEDIFGFEGSKNSNDLYFDSDSSWVGVERNTPWWRTSDSDELALFVAQKSVDFLENCDLPTPRITRVKKNLSGNGLCLSRNNMSASLPVRKTGIGSHHHLCAHNSAPASLATGSSCQKLRMVAEDKLLLAPDKPLSPKPEMDASDEDASKAKLLEALRHSQTRAREAEKAAKQACADKEHVVKLVFRQASQLFAYKQWLHLLQLENMSFQLREREVLSASSVFHENVPWASLKTRKTRKERWKPLSRKRARKARRPQFDVGKYAIVFAFGFGVVSFGLLLGWSIGWMLPTF